MRAFRAVLAVVGGCAVVLAIVVDVASGRSAGAGWVLVVPLPFYAVALFAYLRRPDHPAVGWMLVAGASSVVGFANDALLPAGCRLDGRVGADVARTVGDVRRRRRHRRVHRPLPGRPRRTAA